MNTLLPGLKTQVKGNAPTMEQLTTAGKRGILVRNPDNDFVFRVAFYSWEGCLPGLKFYKADSKEGARPMKGIFMSRLEIESYLAGVELVQAAPAHTDRT